MPSPAFLVICAVSVVNLGFVGKAQLLFRAQSDTRIINGYKCSPKNHPYAVNLFVDSAACGGALITLQWVLTAAHCIETECYWYNCLIRTGFHEAHELAQTQWAKKSIRHPKYVIGAISVTREFRYDIGLVLLIKPFWPNEVCAPIKLPSSAYTMRCTEVKVMGSGRTEPMTPKQDLAKELRCVDLKIVPLKTCKYSYPMGRIDSSVLCTEGKDKDSCAGDSGGPLVCGNVLVALVSAGGGCAMGFPGTNTEVKSHLNFISSTMKEYKSDGTYRRLFSALVIVSWNYVNKLVQ